MQEETNNQELNCFYNQNDTIEDKKIEEEEDEIDWEILESIIQNLLDSLKEKDTIIRWSAAKGIGRLVQRLDKE